MSFLVSQENSIVNSFWHGPGLSPLELLTIRSFINQGHRFRLWTYHSPIDSTINGLEIMDANGILPESSLFTYEHTNQFGHGKGSVSGFSDIFRYKLLYDVGGWWVDMDVTCLKPLNVSASYFFPYHGAQGLVGNVMKCPKGSEVMRLSYEQALRQITSQNRDWHLPICILAGNVRALSLEKYVVSGFGPEDHWSHLTPYLFNSQIIPDSFHYIHWMNEEWRSKSLDKTTHIKNSTFGKLLEQHGIVSRPKKGAGRLASIVSFQVKRYGSGVQHYLNLL